VEFRILGPLQVLHEGRELALGPAKEQTILAVLLLHANETVSRERLVDELWGDSPPATAIKAVNVYISQLRKALVQNGADPIVTRAPGYAIRVDRDLLDAARFEELVAEARRRAAAGELLVATQLFREALALWRGPALSGLTLESFARTEVERLEELRLAALLDRIDCELSLGSHEELVGELETVVAQNPLRERARAQLMLALYRSGRQADALRAYAQARETLVEELGLDPSPALQRLERAILNHDPALEAPAGVSRIDTSAAAPARDKVPVTRKPHRLPRLVVIGVLVAVAVAVAVVLTARSHGFGSIAPSSVGVIDPRSNHITAQINVPDEPGSIAVGNGLVWFTNAQQSNVTQLDPRTHAIVRTISVDTVASNIVVGAGVAWTLEPDPFNAVERLTPGSPTARTIAIPRRRYDLTIDQGKPALHASCSDFGGLASLSDRIWFVCGGFAETFGSVDPSTNRVSVGQYHGPAGPTGGVVEHGISSLGAKPPGGTGGMAVAGGSLWILNHGNTVTQYHPASATAEQTVSGLSNPAGIAAGANSLWITNFDSGTVSRLALTGPGLPPTVTTIPVGRQPTAIAYGAGAVWAASTEDRTISRIDPRTNRVVATIKIGAVPAAVAVGAGHVWVTTRSSSEVPSG
jgi:DNA-binding SARP family transcriptional activator/streptogramin lyase